MANLDKIERFRADCLQDIAFFAQNPVAPLHIAPETGPIAKVELRRAQARLAEVVDRQWYTRNSLRVIVCKARRIGSTTFFCMDAYRQATMRPNMNVVIGAQLDDMAERIHERNHIFHSNCPPALRPERHGRSRSFKEPMDFRRTPEDEEIDAWEAGGQRPDMGLNSSISIFTERTPLARTGATIQYLLLSEFAKYRNQSTIIKEMFPTVRRGLSIPPPKDAETRTRDSGKKPCPAGLSLNRCSSHGWTMTSSATNTPAQARLKTSCRGWNASEGKTGKASASTHPSSISTKKKQIYFKSTLCQSGINSAR